MQPPTTDNDLVLWDISFDTLKFITPVALSNLYILYTSGGNNGTSGVTVNFTDNTSQLFTGISTSNWCSGTLPASAIFNRTQRSASTTCSIATCQYMYEISLAISAANQFKPIKSISVSNLSFGNVLNLFAVGGMTTAPLVAPVIPAQATNTCSGAAFTVAPVDNPPTTVVPAGTTYSWGIPVVTGGITGGASGSGAASITGTLNNPTTTNQTATYTVTPTSGLTGAPFTVTVTVNPKPTTPVVTQTGNSLHSSSATGNHWYNVASGIILSATNQTYSPTASGYYYVIVITNGCTSDTSNIFHYLYNGINANELNKTINVYPNPVSNELVLELKGNIEQQYFEIINSIGQTVYKGYLKEKTLVQTTDFAQGVYLIKLQNGNTFEFKKILKE